jgi:hypothetical protein
MANENRVKHLVSLISLIEKDGIIMFFTLVIKRKRALALANLRSEWKKNKD